MSAQVPKLPYILLGLMTVGTFGGPFLIGVVMQGGEVQGWPPDRPVEWWTFGLVTSFVFGLMGVLLGLCVKSIRAIPRPPVKERVHE